MKFAWFCMEMRSRTAASIFPRFPRSRDFVCMRLAFPCARLPEDVLFYKATARIVNVNPADCMNFRSYVGRNRNLNCSVTVVNKKKCKLTYQIKNRFFQDPLMVVNFFGPILKVLLFSGFRYIHFPISTCSHSIKQDQKIVSFVMICFLRDEVHFIGAVCNLPAYSVTSD